MEALYLETVRRAVAAYPLDRIDRYIEDVWKDGIREHGFARLAANIGILLANGERNDLCDRFFRMMDIFCRTAEEARAKNGGTVGNDFAVREICTTIAALERAGLYPEKTAAWRELLSHLDPMKTYTCLVTEENPTPANWALFAAASEQARAYIGLPADMDFIDRQIGSQLWRFDENGMYRDPHNPMVYDLVSRALAAFILKSGYRGCYAEKLRAQLLKSVDITIAMLSVDGEIPFGGRSNQMLMTEGWYAAVCEYYLSELSRDDDRRGLLASCLAAAKKFTTDWLGMDGFRHVKNFYPTDSPVGCEGYAYFDKYMVTLGSVYTLAALLSDGAEITPRERDSFITATGPDFHKIFLYNGTIFAEYETKADPAYDANGIGRVHFRGAPPQLVLSVPCPASGGNYTLDESSGLPLSICPVLCEDGIVTACSGASFEPDEMRENGDRVFLSMETTLETGDELTESVLLDGERFEYTVGGDAICGAAFPVLLSDGAEHTKIVMDGQSLTVTYRGYTARYETDGVIENTGHICANRNGLYAFYTAAGDGGVTLTVTVSKNSKKE